MTATHTCHHEGCNSPEARGAIRLRQGYGGQEGDRPPKLKQPGLAIG